MTFGLIPFHISSKKRKLMKATFFKIRELLKFNETNEVCNGEIFRLLYEYYCFEQQLELNFSNLISLLFLFFCTFLICFDSCINKIYLIIFTSSGFNNTN